ncbi:MAG: NAD(P)-dependent oxidoreductase [Aestuariivita sp.]|nr:NAD(P)-dependent oxidoreductase [Aestuariivita sp.]
MATQPMLKFVTVERTMPSKRAVKTRKSDFDEIYSDFSAARVKEQSSRCSQCGVPYCQTHCPLHNNIPDWLLLTAQNRLEEAYHLSQETNTFPEICGRICPQDRLCEGNCVIEQSGHGTVTIGSVEKHITETAWQEGWVKPLQPAFERSEHIAIIGAGPGGLAAAQMLRETGLQVTIFDRYDRAGGLLTYGIPGFKLEKDVVMRRIDHLKQSGIKFKMNYDVNENHFKEIRAAHNATIIATGVYKSRSLDIQGVNKPGVIEAIDYLTASNRKSFGDNVIDFDSGLLNAKGKRILVIGGGDTAMDCVRTAVRQGATSVKCLYRRDRINMPGSQREVYNAEEEGVEFKWLSAPESIKVVLSEVTGTDATSLSVSVNQIRLGAPDTTGRRIPEKVDGAVYNEEADLIIKAIGFEPENLPQLFGEPQLEVTRWGTIKAEAISGKTALNDVYAIGDIVRGASLVVWAIRDGRDCANAIVAELNKSTAIAAE